MLYLENKNHIIKEEKRWLETVIFLKLARELKINYHATLIKTLNNLISSNKFIERHRLRKNSFIRNRSLTFKIVILFIINLLKSSLQNELDKFFKVIKQSDLPERTVTDSAFSQARKKLSHRAFIDLDKEQIKYFYSNADNKTWYGFRLVAIDGSTIRLPKNEETIKEFGEYSHSEKATSIVLARVSQSFDVFNHITLDSSISPLSVGEYDLAVEHIKYGSEIDLDLLDRGYSSFWLFSLILSRRQNFCARINVNNWNAAKELISSGEKEKIIEIKPSVKSLARCKKLKLPVKPLKIRFICIELNNGEKEVLATSLMDSEKHPYELFKDLYHNRWPVEELYKLIKSRVEVENFTGKYPESIKQDFHALIFLSNLTSILAFPIHSKIKKKCKKRKYDYKINWTQAIAKMKDSVVLLFMKNYIVRVVEKLLFHFVNNIIPIRPNRTFPRIKKPKKHFFMAYKPIS